MLCGDVFLLIFRISGIAAADIQKGKRITHAAFGKTGNQGSGILVNQDVFLLADIFDPFGDDLRSMRRKSNRWQRERMVAGIL